ncbi:MAG: hypothetical protein ACREB3_00005, partial [Burkholderiales bacterium]
PYQLPVVEQGPTGGLPLANATFISQWHDAYRMHIEDIIVTQTGASVSSGDTSNLPDTLLRFSGQYLLDLYAVHSNATFRPFILNVDMNFASALGATFGTVSQAFVVPISEVVGGNFFSTRVQINSRLFRVRWTYPAVNSTFFAFNAVLRAA